MIRLFKFSEVSPEDVFARVSPTAQVDGVVADIIADVRKRGDAALLEYCGYIKREKAPMEIVFSKGVMEAQRR